MAAGITSAAEFTGVNAAKSTGAEAQRQALEAEVAGLNQRIREQDRQIGYLAELVAEAEARGAQPAAAPPPAPAPALAAAPPAPAPVDPAVAVREREDGELRALAIVAGENPQGGSRRFWTRALDQLGRHLQPDASVTEQRDAALQDPRGRDFIMAIQSCRE